MHIRLLVALTGAAFLSVTESAPDPPLCRVTAEYRPVSWPTWAEPEERFRRITVRLRPGCPPNGIARVHLFNVTSGRRLPESGSYTLTTDRPALTIPGTPAYAVTTPGWDVFWKANNGRLWSVPQTQLSPRGGAP